MFHHYYIAQEASPVHTWHFPGYVGRV